MSRSWLVAALGGLSLLAAATPVSAAKAPIKIGVPVPLSGSYAAAGVDIVNGAKLAVAKINGHGGVLGRPLQLIPVDDACDAQTATQAAQNLVAQGVVAVAGGYCSSASLPESTVFHAQGDIPFVLDASTNPQLTEQGFNDIFRTIGRDDEQGPFAANIIANVLHAKNVVVMDDNSTYAVGLQQNTTKALKAYGVHVTVEHLTPGQSDYTSVLTQINQLHPQVLYYTGYFTEMGLLLKQARQLGYKFTMVGGDATNDPTVLKTAGAAANGFMLTTSPLAQFLGSASGYLKAYHARFHTAPGPYSVYEYDAVQVLAQAIKNAKSTNPKAIDAALAKTKNFRGLTGRFSFNKFGDRSPAVYITLKVVNGKFTAFEELNAAGKWIPVPR
jgi:branched-chain amino acid transport system substrate-binding protein